MTKLLNSCTALTAVVVTLLQSIAAAAQTSPLVTAQPAANDATMTGYFIDPASEPSLSTAELTTLLRQKIKYVFVIFHENHSFDNEYGTLPGVNGLYSNGGLVPTATQSFQDYQNKTYTVSARRLGPQQNATVVDSVDHSHTGLATKIDVQGGAAKMDRMAYDEYKKYNNNTAAGDAKGKQFAWTVMSHIDCDTIPFFWRYASRFTIFDNIFATEDTPSSPNAVAMIAGQSGETQWVKHGSDGTTAQISGTINGVTYTGTGTTQGVPLVNDPNPYWGSQFDTTSTNRQPTSPKESYAASGGVYNIAPNLTFATVPLTAMGSNVQTVTGSDAAPASDLADVQQDIPYIQGLDRNPVSWRWYQNGYDLEANDVNNVASHDNYVAHHQGPQYFGYLANNPALRTNFRGETDFFNDVRNNNLPSNGGVFYIRGGFGNNQNLSTPIQNPNYPAALTETEIATIKTAKAGDDDHPSYSDRQISEAMTARVINSIASNPTLWAQSAIIITYDESDGFYDHVPPRILSYGPDGLPLSRGVRVPMIVISPYARVHAVSHAEGDHNAVIETVNAVFNLPALSSLPDEAQALAAGNAPAFNQFGPAGFEQKYLGPRDMPSPVTDSLLSAFDPQRLTGSAPVLPGSYAMIDDAIVTSLPHYDGNGCQAIGVTPTDLPYTSDAPPANLNTLPATLPAYNIPVPPSL